MRIIRVNANGGTVEVLDIDNDSYELAKAIGDRCDLVEVVRPIGLVLPRLSEKVWMLVDESGLYHHLGINLIGSALYGNPIMGNILFVGVKNNDFISIDEESFVRLSYLLEEMRKNIYEEDEE